LLELGSLFILNYAEETEPLPKSFIGERIFYTFKFDAARFLDSSDDMTFGIELLAVRIDLKLTDGCDFLALRYFCIL